MAEGFARHYGKDVIEVHSAGLLATRVHPVAVAVMKEVGIDISNQNSQEIDEGLLNQMDVIMTPLRSRRGVMSCNTAAHKTTPLADS